MTNPTNFRAAQARRMAELIEQARTLDEQTKTQANQAPSQVEREVQTDPTRVSQQAPAHRLQEQYSNNIEALGRGSEAFARNNQDPAKIVVKSGQAGIDYDRNPDTPNQGVGLRTPATNPKLRAENQTEEPMYIRQPIEYEKAIDNNEEIIAELQNAPTTGAVAQMGTEQVAQETSEEVAGTPAQATDTLEKEEVASAANQEVTNANFQYDESEMAFYKLAEGAILESGEGASVVDQNRTKTHVIIPDELRNADTQQIALDDVDPND